MSDGRRDFARMRSILEVPILNDKFWDKVPVVAADAITDVDITAAEVLTRLHQDLAQRGIELWFAGLKGPVRDRLHHYGTLQVVGNDIFAPTVGRAVNQYRQTYRVAWKDWDEV